MKSRLLAGIAALVLAVVGAILVVSYAQGADSRAVQGLQPVTVLVVSKAVPAGTSVAALKAFVTSQDLPGKAVSKSALTNLDGLAGKVTAVDLLPGEQLVAERLIEPEALKASGAIEVPKGLQEVSFQLEPQRRRRRPSRGGRPCGCLHQPQGRRPRGEGRQGNYPADGTQGSRDGCPARPGG